MNPLVAVLRDGSSEHTVFRHREVLGSLAPSAMARRCPTVKLIVAYVFKEVDDTQGRRGRSHQTRLPNLGISGNPVARFPHPPPSPPSPPLPPLPISIPPDAKLACTFSICEVQSQPYRCTQPEGHKQMRGAKFHPLFSFLLPWLPHS